MIDPIENKKYLLRHNQQSIVATFLQKRVIPGFQSPHSFYRRNEVTHYMFRNERTGRTLEIKSRTKIKAELA